MIIHQQLSCSKFTAKIVFDRRSKRIIDAAPIFKKFEGVPNGVKKLHEWIYKIDPLFQIRVLSSASHYEWHPLKGKP